MSYDVQILLLFLYKFKIILCDMRWSLYVIQIVEDFNMVYIQA